MAAKPKAAKPRRQTGKGKRRPPRSTATASGTGSNAVLKRSVLDGPMRSVIHSAFLQRPQG